MPVFKNLIERIRQSEDYSDLKSSSVRDILNGNILTKKFIRKQYLLLALMVVLSIFYIDNRYSSEKQITKITELKRKIQDAKYESLTISAELMEISRQTNILLLLQSKGIQLKPATTPPIVVE
jgi:hypothetical protein